MTQTTRALPLAAILAVLATPAGAQVCRGTADIAAATPMLGGGTLIVAEDTVGFTGLVVGGGDTAFGEADVGVRWLGTPDATFLTAQGTIGAQVAPANRVVVVCPMGTVSFVRSDDFGGTELTNLGFGGGVAVGGQIGTGAIRAVPTVSVIVERVRVRQSLGDLFVVAHKNVGTLEIGAGLALDRFTIRPSIRVPFLIDGGGTSFRLVFVAGG